MCGSRIGWAIHSGLMPCPPSCAGSTAVRRRRPPLPLLLVLLVVLLLLSTGRESTEGESRTADDAVASGQASLPPLPAPPPPMHAGPTVPPRNHRLTGGRRTHARGLLQADPQLMPVLGYMADLKSQEELNGKGPMHAPQGALVPPC